MKSDKNSSTPTGVLIFVLILNVISKYHRFAIVHYEYSLLYIRKKKYEDYSNAELTKALAMVIRLDEEDVIKEVLSDNCK